MVDKDLILTSFGEQLRFLRRRMQLTQQKLGIALGYSAALIGRLENDERLPDIAMVKTAYIEALGLQHEPELAQQLVAAAIVARRQRTDDSTSAKPVISTRPTRIRISNLPAPLNGIIGRDHEIVEIQKLLATNRLVTITGTGGVGKTRLAIEVAHRLDHEFTDGVCFVALAPIADADRVGAAVLQTLGGPTGTEQTVIDTLVRRLVGMRLLLVLDNFEHLLSAASLVVELLARTTELKIITTSRTPLHISRESIYEVAPLSVPDSGYLAPADELLTCPAVALFVQRAQQVKPSFLLMEANAHAVAQLCRSLDGLPLAIELAASRLRAFTPLTILSHLNHHLGSRLQLLTVGMKDSPPRQQTLRAAIDWSFNLLTGQEQQLFQHMGVFAGGCTLEAIHAVCTSRIPIDVSTVSSARLAEPDEESPSETVDLAQSLVDKSLVQQVEGADGESRYNMLQTILEYALDRLEASGEIESIRHRHMRYYAQTCNVDLDSSNWAIACTGVLKSYIPERDNLYAALMLSREDSDPLPHLLISTVLGWLTYVGGWYLGFRGDKKAAADEITAALQRNIASPPAPRATAMQGLGMLAGNLSDPEHARRLNAESLSLSLAADALGLAASASHLLAYGAYFSGDLAQAENYFKQESEVGERIGSQGWVLNGITLLGHLAMDRNNFQQAEEHLKCALNLACSLGIRSGILCGQAVILQDLGMLAYEQGQFDSAYELGHEALLLFEEEGETLRRCNQLYYLARIALAQGHIVLAELHLKQCLGLIREYGIPALFEYVLMGQIAAEQANRVRCARLTGRAAYVWPRASMLWGYKYANEQNRKVAAIAEARTHLDDPSFAAAWEEGQRMTRDQVIEYALS